MNAETFNQKKKLKERISLKRLHFDKNKKKFYIVHKGKKIYLTHDALENIPYVREFFQRQGPIKDQKHIEKRRLARLRQPYTRQSMKAIVLEQQLQKANQDLLQSNSRIEELQKRLFINKDDEKTIAKIHIENEKRKNLEEKANKYFNKLMFETKSKSLGIEKIQPMQEQLKIFEEQKLESSNFDQNVLDKLSAINQKAQEMIGQTLENRKQLWSQIVSETEDVEQALKQKNEKHEKQHRKLAQNVQKQKKFQDSLRPRLKEGEEPGFYQNLAYLYEKEKKKRQNIEEMIIEEESKVPGVTERAELDRLTDARIIGVKMHNQSVKVTNETREKLRGDIQKLVDAKLKLNEAIKDELERGNDITDLQQQRDQVIQLQKESEDLLKAQSQQLLKQYYQEQSEQAFGKHTNQAGLELQQLISLILHDLGDKENEFDIIVITDDKEKIHTQKKNQIVIFLKDHHYTGMIHQQEKGEICYFNSYGSHTEEDEERRLRDLKQISEFALNISPENEIKYKYNVNRVQTDDNSKGFDDSSSCGYFLFCFFHDYSVLNLPFKVASQWKNIDLKEMERLQPYSFKKFPFI